MNTKPIIIFFAMLIITIFSVNAQQFDQGPVCAQVAQELAISCDRGEITRDEYRGCRFVTCENPEGSLAIKVCDIGGFPPSTFDVWKINTTGETLQICLGQTCFESGDSFMRGEGYPVCGATPEHNVTLTHDTPIEHNVVWKCEALGFSPERYEWDFGDGTSEVTEGNEVFHTYLTDDRFTATCRAIEGDRTATAKNSVAVYSPLEEIDPDFPFHADIVLGEAGAGAFRMTCEDLGFVADGFAWYVDDALVGEEKTIVHTFDDGTHEVRCEADHDGTAITDTRLLSTDSPGQLEETTLLDGLLAYYPEDGNHKDLAGGHNGIESRGDPVLSDGKIGEAFTYDGDDQVMADMQEITGARTIAAWVKPSAGPDGAIWQIKPVIDLFRFENGHIAARTIDRSPRVGAATTYAPVPEGEWHHFVAVLADGKVYLYHNGQLAGSDDDVSSAREFAFRWGAHDTDHEFRGTIDEIGVWNRPLDADEIGQLYNNHAGLPYPFDANETAPGSCFDQVTLEIPASCEGEITSDEIRGDSCRYIACEDGLAQSTVKACNKPSDFITDFFEIIRVESAVRNLDVCIGDTCLGKNNYVRSPDMPVCFGSKEEAPPEDDAPEEEDDAAVDLRTKEWYPQGMDYVFVCEESGYDAASYSWNFGDGHTQTTATSDVFHTYAGPGEYEVSCTASNGESESDTLQITVS